MIVRLVLICPVEWPSLLLRSRVGRGERLLLRKGVRDILLRRERNRFIKEEWPDLRSRQKRLGIDIRTLAQLDD